MKRIIIGITAFLLTYTAYAQQDPMFTQYMFNTMAVNPGYAGSRGALSLNGLFRAQWVGLDGAPMTQTFFAHTPLLNKSMGVGVSLVNDKIGPVNQTVVYGDYAFSIRVGEASRLAFGLKGGFNLMRIGLSEVKTIEANDQAFKNDFKTSMLPNFGFGMYYYNDRYYVGVSTPKLIENKLDDGGGLVASKANEQRHYFIIAGYVWDISSGVKFKPSVLAKMTEGAPISYDISANFLFNDKLWVGGAFRREDAFSLLLQLNVTEQFSVGYAYDFILSDLSSYNGGSHEIMLRYDFVFKKDKILSPRYF